MISRLEKRINFQSGFSLVETLVAISLLLLVISGPMTITSRSAKSTSFASEQVQAFFLAQEGIELAQKLRDDRLLVQFSGGTDAWNDFTTGPALASCRTGTGCGLHWSTSDVVEVINCSTVSNCRLNYRTSDDRARFTHTSNMTTQATAFTRVIYFTVSGNNVLVRSEVTWRTGSIINSQRVEVQTYLYDIH